MAGRILIADGVATNRIVLRSRLGAARYDAHLAATGADCLRMAVDGLPDLVILDRDLPDMDGLDVLRAIRANPATRDTPVLLTAMAATLSLRHAALRSGADHVMSKPVDEHRLLARMRALIRGHDRDEELRLRNATQGLLGLADAGRGFEHRPLVAVVTTRLTDRSGLHPSLPADIVWLSPGEALADGARNPDAFLIRHDVDSLGDGSALRLISELRSRSSSRNAAICLTLPTMDSKSEAIALDLGANDVASAKCDPEELALRMRRLLQRKQGEDRLRATVETGLRLALIDPLTGLHNRRYAMAHLARQLAAPAKPTASLAVMLIDLDRFKSVNDIFGHAAGDSVLIEVARRLKAATDGASIVARIGGEEFLVALPDTGLKAARTVAEHLCRIIEETPIIIDNHRDVSVTISIGVASSLPTEGIGPDAVAGMIARADHALLLSKDRGRNMVTICKSAA
jgi:two-component system cell cycle response regulator